MESSKKDCKSLINRCELQIRTSALNSFGASPEEQADSTSFGTIHINSLGQVHIVPWLPKY